MGELTLPQGFLGEKAEYVTVSVGIDIPYVRIPSAIFPSNKDIVRISGTLAKFLSSRPLASADKTEEQSVLPIKSSGGIAFIVQPKTDGIASRVYPNYIVVGTGFSAEGFQGLAYIFTSASCKYDKSTLEAFVAAIR